MNDSKDMSFIEHLEVLRWHLVRSALVVALFMILAFTHKSFIFNTLILSPKSPDFFTNMVLARLAEVTGMPFLQINNIPFELINITMSGQFLSHIWISLAVGLIAATPYVLWEIWRFIKPALHHDEQRVAQGSVFFISLLFFVGVLFGYYIIVPLSINFLSSYTLSVEVVNQIKLSSYVSLISSIVLASGLVFELPMFVYFFSRMSILTPQGMRKYRKHAYVVLLILSAIITPPDVFSQVLICIPLVFLYEFSILLAKRVQKKQLNP
ncbi:MAG: twin-arginine translocase subunit TatC [Mangrovibacterium sp.]